MSRTGKKPISLPEKVDVKFEGLSITVKGPKGELQRTLPNGVSLSKDENFIFVKPINEKRQSREMHGLCRSLVANMVEGVSNGFTKKLEIVGVGSRAQVKGKTLAIQNLFLDLFDLFFLRVFHHDFDDFPAYHLPLEGHLMIQKFFYLGTGF